MGNRNKKKNNNGRPSTTGSNKNESNTNNSTSVNRFVSLDQSSVAPSVSSRTSRRSHGSARSRRSNASRQRRPPQQSNNANESESVVDIFQQHMHQLEQTQQSQSPYKFTPEQKTREVIFRHDSNERHKRSVTTQIAMFLAPNTDTVDDLHSPFFKQFLQQFVLARIITDGPEEEYERYMFAIAEEEYLLYGKKNGETPALASAYAFNKFIHTTLAENMTPVITIKFLDGVQSIPYPQDSSNTTTPSQQSSDPQETVSQDKDNTPVTKSKSNVDPSDASAPVLRPMWYQTPPQQYWSNAQVPGTCTVIPSPSSHPHQPVHSVNHYQKSPLVPTQQPVPPPVYPYQQSPSMSDRQYNTVPPSPTKNPRFPTVNNPVQLRMEALGKESFCSRTFHNCVSSLKITENSITGMQKFYTKLTGAATSALKSPRKVFPTFQTLTQSTNLVEEMLGPVQSTAVYTKAVDNYNIISHQFHLLLTTSEIFDSSMTEARNVIKTKGLLTDCGFQLLFQILQEYLPSMGATSFSVTDEIMKLKIDRGETLQSLYEHATSIAVSLQLSQQVVPTHDLLQRYFKLLLNTHEYSSYIHHKASDFFRFIKLYKNHPYHETIQSIYEYLKPLKSVDTTLTPIKSDLEASSTTLESNSATHQQKPYIDARNATQNKTTSSKQSSSKPGQKRFRHPQCRICGRRHPENQCAYLPKEYQPKVLLQNADRFLKMNPTIKPNPDWVNKTDFPPITSSFAKSTNVTEIIGDEEIEDDKFYDITPEVSSIEKQVETTQSEVAVTAEVGATELEPDYFDDCVYDYYNPTTATDIEAGLTEIRPEVNMASIFRLQDTPSDDDSSNDSDDDSSNSEIPNLISRVRSDDSSDVESTAPNRVIPNLIPRVRSDDSSDVESTQPIIWTVRRPPQLQTPYQLYQGNQPLPVWSNPNNPVREFIRSFAANHTSDDDSNDSVPTLVHQVDPNDDGTETTVSMTITETSAPPVSTEPIIRRLPVFINITSDEEHTLHDEDNSVRSDVSATPVQDNAPQWLFPTQDTPDNEAFLSEFLQQDDDYSLTESIASVTHMAYVTSSVLETPDRSSDDTSESVASESIESVTHLASVENNAHEGSEETTSAISEEHSSDGTSESVASVENHTDNNLENNNSLGFSSGTSLDWSSNSSTTDSQQSTSTYESAYTNEYTANSESTRNIEQLHHNTVGVHNYGADQREAFINHGRFLERYNTRHYLHRMCRAHNLLRRFMDLRHYRLTHQPQAWTTYDDTFIYQLLDTYFHMGFSLSPVEAQRPSYDVVTDDPQIPHHSPLHPVQERFEDLHRQVDSYLARTHYNYYPAMPYPDTTLDRQLDDMETRLEQFIESQDSRVSVLSTTDRSTTTNTRDFFRNPQLLNSESNNTNVQWVVPESTRPSFAKRRFIMDTGSNSTNIQFVLPSNMRENFLRSHAASSTRPLVVDTVDTDSSVTGLPEINMAETVSPLQSIIQSNHKAQAKIITKPSFRLEFLVDTGANCHILKDARYLFDIRQTNEPVRQSGGSYATAAISGTATVNLGPALQTEFHVLPDAPRNIISPPYLKRVHGYKKAAHDPNEIFHMVDSNNNFVSIPYLDKNDPEAPTPFIYIDNGLDILVTTIQDMSLETSSTEQYFNKAFFYHCAWNHTERDTGCS